jgi:hypothetical protein
LLVPSLTFPVRVQALGPTKASAATYLTHKRAKERMQSLVEQRAVLAPLLTALIMFYVSFFWALSYLRLLHTLPILFVLFISFYLFFLPLLM